MKEKNKLIIGILLGIGMTLLLSAGTLIIYDKFLANDDNQQIDGDNNSNNDESGEITNLQLSDDLVKNLASKVIGRYDSNTLHYTDYFYKRDKVILANESLEFRLSMAANAVASNLKSIGSDCKNDIGGIYYIDENTLKESYYEIFGKDSVYNRTSFHISYICGPGTFNWSDINNRYEANAICGCGGGAIGGTMTELAYAKQVKTKIETKIEIYEYFAFVDYSSEKIKYYSDYAQKNLINSDQITTANIFEKYKDKVGLYKYTFVQDDNGTYVFTSVEKVR